MPPPPINLFKGHPSPALHPASALASAAAAVLHSAVAPVALNYGDDEGFAPLRDAIGTWLADYYHRASAAASNRSPSPSLAIPADRIVITGGASQNLANVLAVFADPSITRHVWLVAPTYYLACRIFDDAGFSGRLRAVPEDNEGIDVVALEKALAAAERVHGTRAAVCASPVIHRWSPPSPPHLMVDMLPDCLLVQNPPALAQDIQASHLWRAHLFQPVRQSHDGAAAAAARAAGTAV